MPQRGELRVLGVALLLVGLAAAQHLLVVLILVVGRAGRGPRSASVYSRRVSANDHGLDRNRFFSSIATMPPALSRPLRRALSARISVEQRELLAPRRRPG